MSVRVFKVGPLENGESIYVPIGVTKQGAPTSLDPVEGTDDVSALQQILAQDSSDPLVCSPELAAAAQTLGLAVEELPAHYEGGRIQLAISYAQGGALENLRHARSLLRLMTGMRDFLDAKVASRWPARHSFEIELRGDRSDTFAGWLTADAEPTITIVRSPADAKELALSTPEARAERLASLDHLSVTLATPPRYALELIHAFYGIQVMPRLEKRENGELATVNDEDALLMAGVLAALSIVHRLDEVGHSETETPGRKVRTFVSAAAPYPFVALP